MPSSRSFQDLCQPSQGLTLSARVPLVPCQSPEVSDLPHFILSLVHGIVSFLPPSLRFSLPSSFFLSLFLFCQVAFLVPSDPWPAISRSPPERCDRQGHCTEWKLRPESTGDCFPPAHLSSSLCSHYHRILSGGTCNSAFGFILLAYRHFVSVPRESQLPLCEKDPLTHSLPCLLLKTAADVSLE